MVSVDLVPFLSVRFLFWHSFKGTFNMYLIYFTFIKYVENSKDLSQPLRAKGVKISKSRHDKATLSLKKFSSC